MTAPPTIPRAEELIRRRRRQESPAPTVEAGRSPRAAGREGGDHAHAVRPAPAAAVARAGHAGNIGTEAPPPAAVEPVTPAPRQLLLLPPAAAPEVKEAAAEPTTITPPPVTPPPAPAATPAEPAVATPPTPALPCTRAARHAEAPVHPQQWKPHRSSLWHSGHRPRSDDRCQCRRCLPPRHHGSRQRPLRRLRQPRLPRRQRPQHQRTSRSDANTTCAGRTRCGGASSRRPRPRRLRRLRCRPQPRRRRLRLPRRQCAGYASHRRTRQRTVAGCVDLSEQSAVVGHRPIACTAAGATRKARGKPPAFDLPPGKPEASTRTRPELTPPVTPHAILIVVSIRCRLR